jgi:hypothetical protein
MAFLHSMRDSNTESAIPDSGRLVAWPLIMAYGLLLMMSVEWLVIATFSTILSYSIVLIN